MILYLIITFSAIAYIAIILTFYVGLGKVLAGSPSCNAEKVKLSVVVAFRDEEKNLPVLLDAFLKQSISNDLYELILVNDHSTDESIALIQGYIHRFQNLLVVDLPAGTAGKKAALAYGVSLSKNPIIVFADADCIPSGTWLESLLFKFSSNIDFVIGPVALSPIDSFIQKMQSLEYSSFMATAAGSCGVKHPIIASSANLAFRKELLNVDSTSLNGRLSSGDDMFLLHSVKKIEGYKIDFLNSTNGIVYTSTEPTLSRALDQRKRWASKSVYYKDFDTVFASIVVFVFNLLLVGLFVGSLIQLKYLLALLCLLCVKSLVDFLLLRRYLRFTKQEELLKVFIPLQFLYPLYVVYTFFSGLFFRTTWKGRRIR